MPIFYVNDAYTRAVFIFDTTLNILRDLRMLK